MENIGWYPNPLILDTLPSRINPNIDLADIVKEEYKLNWDPKLKYTSTLWWSNNIKKQKKEKCRRYLIKGIEVRGNTNIYPF